MRRARTGIVDYVSPALSEAKQQRIAEKLSKAAQPVAFLILRDSQCSECGAEIRVVRRLA